MSRFGNGCLSDSTNDPCPDVVVRQSDSTKEQRPIVVMSDKIDRTNDPCPDAVRVTKGAARMIDVPT